MATWHRLGTEAELRERAPFAVKLEHHRIAIFHHDGQFRAISDICNHRGGPLSEGWLRSSPEDVMDQRTCVILRFRGSRIAELRDYTDAAIYEAFLARHRAELPKFSARPAP